MEREVTLMAMPAWMPEAWNKLSAENQKKAESIIQVLLTQLSEEKPVQKPRKTKLQFDVMKGKIKIADNFDDPLQGFIS